MLTSLVYIAGLIGLVIFSAFSQKIGRNELLIAASCMELLGLGCTLLSGYFKSIWMEIIAIMFTYAGTEMAYQSIYCFSTEVVREKSRIFYVNALNSIYGVGIMVDAITFYFVKDWTIIYACVFGIPALLILIGAFFFVEKTPINLLEV
jgi:MFS family permease